jgi:hypothetical protein
MSVFKKLVKCVLVILMLSVLSQGCKSGLETTAAEYREIAWTSLTEAEQTGVTSDWRNAPVNFEDKYWETGEDAVSVTFDTDSFLGPIVVYIDPITNVVLGQGLRL